MKKTIGLFALMLVIVAGIYFAFASGKRTDAKTIVAILPLTGSSAMHGEYAKRGIEMAIAAMPAEKRMRVAYEDSQMDPKVAISEFNKYVGQGNVVAFLSLGSPVAMAIKPLAVEHKTVLLSIVSAPAYSSVDDYTFRINGTADVEMDAVLQKIEILGVKKLAVVYQNDDYGVGLVNKLKQKYGKSLVAEEGFLPSSNDFRTALTKVKSSQPDAIYIAAYAKSVGLVAKQTNELGIKSQLICGSACDNPDLFTAAGTSIEGLIAIAPSPKANSAFEQQYRKAYNQDLNFVSIRMYDAVNLIANAVDSCKGNSNKGCIKDEIHGVKDFPGVAFAVNFDKNGDLMDRFIIKKVTNGVFQVQE